MAEKNQNSITRVNTGQDNPDGPVCISLNNISLKYGSLDVLKNIKLNIRQGEVHALVGEHGAGKSSLAHIISGFRKPDSGSIIINHENFKHLTSEDAIKNRIGIVTQDNPLFPELTVADNILINHAAGVFKFITRSGSVRKVKELIAKYEFDIDPSKPLKKLNHSDKALVDILKQLYREPNLLILDEVLVKLSGDNQKKVRRILNALKAQGMAVLYITNRIDDIYNFADRVSILREGELIATDFLDNMDKMTLIRLAYTHVLSEDQIRETLNFSHILKYNEAILNYLPVNLIVIDKEKRIKLVNEYARKLLNIKRDTPKKPMEEPMINKIFLSGNDKMTGLILQGAEEEKEVSYYQVPLQINKKNTINNLVVYPIFDNTHIIGHIIIIDDVTGHEKMREQVILSENLSSLGLLAAGVAHEINNPLDIMNYYLEHIKFNSKNEKVLDAVESMNEEINSIAQIVGNLITFSDKKSITNKRFNINSLTSDLMGLVAYNAEQSGIRMSLDTPVEPLFIDANRNEIKQVLLNLVKNSFEAMTGGGELKITLTCLVGKSAEVGRDKIEITFKDTGPGIDESRINEIFLPFYSSKAGNEGNSGLGLSISYGIVKKYNGSIIAENRSGTGACFRVILPVVPAV